MPSCAAIQPTPRSAIRSFAASLAPVIAACAFGPA
jgi:hypothetical protein